MAPRHEIAHLGHAELLTPEPERSLWFCTDVLGLTETGRAGDSVYLRTRVQAGPRRLFPADDGPGLARFPAREVIGHTLWVTPYRPDERWPCGESATRAKVTTACRHGRRKPAYLRHRRCPLVVFGIHHITRPEDWPVMPLTRCRSG